MVYFIGLGLSADTSVNRWSVSAKLAVCKGLIVFSTSLSWNCKLVGGCCSLNKYNPLRKHPSYPISTLNSPALKRGWNMCICRRRYLFDGNANNKCPDCLAGSLDAALATFVTRWRTQGCSSIDPCPPLSPIKCAFRSQFISPKSWWDFEDIILLCPALHFNVRSKG